MRHFTNLHILVDHVNNNNYSKKPNKISSQKKKTGKQEDEKIVFFAKITVFLPSFRQKTNTIWLTSQPIVNHKNVFYQLV